MAHDFEVYLRDQAMFDPESLKPTQTIDLNLDEGQNSPRKTKDKWAGWP